MSWGGGRGEKGVERVCGGVRGGLGGFERERDLSMNDTSRFDYQQGVVGWVERIG